MQIWCSHEAQRGEVDNHLKSSFLTVDHSGYDWESHIELCFDPDSELSQHSSRSESVVEGTRWL